MFELLGIRCDKPYAGLFFLPMIDCLRRQNQVRYNAPDTFVHVQRKCRFSLFLKMATDFSQCDAFMKESGRSAVSSLSIITKAVRITQKSSR